MVKKIILFGVIVLFLSGCTTTSVPPNALIKLPEKKVVKLTKITPINKDEQMLLEKKILQASVIHKTPAPLWIPPVITKVLILPYIDKTGSLHASHYVFTKLKKGRWLLGNYLVKTDGSVRVLNPLSVYSTNVFKRKEVQERSSESGRKNFFTGGISKPAHSQIYFSNTVKSMKEGGK